MARGRWLALLVCLLGMGLIDQIIARGGDALFHATLPDRELASYLQHARLRNAIASVTEFVAMVLLWFLAMRLSFPHGIQRDECPWLLALSLVMAAGRSVLGVGEGFTAEFGLRQLVTGAVAFALFILWQPRTR